MTTSAAELSKASTYGPTDASQNAPMYAPKSGLRLQGINKQFGASTVLRDIDLTIPQGHLVCFLGPSGCGKTTLLRIIAGLEHPSGGSMHIGEDDITALPANRRDFGMVFQSLALFPHLSVAENIAYPLRLRDKRKTQNAQGGISGKAAIARRVSEMLDLIKLPHMANRAISQLSGGQRQRVAIARAIASSPRILLLDEPLSALDAKLRESMQVEIRQLQQRLGITMILVTHDQREAMTMADEIVVMDNGYIAQFGKPLDIYREPVNEVVADFIGVGNIVPVIQASENQVRLPGGQVISTATRAKTHLKLGNDANQSIKLLIRSEDVMVKTECTQVVPNKLKGTISFILDLGATLEATIDCEGFALIATTSSRALPGLTVGMPVMAELLPDACRVVNAHGAALHK